MEYQKMIYTLVRARRQAIRNSRDFAREAHMSTKTISKIERGFRC